LIKKKTYPSFKECAIIVLVIAIILKYMKKLFAVMAVLGFLLVPLQSVSASPLVQLISPNGGEKYTGGKSVQVKWTSPLPANAQISATLFKLKGSLWNPEGDFYEQVESSYSVLFDDYNNTGHAMWEIPFDQVPGNYAMEFSVNYSEQFSSQYGVAHSAKLFRIEAGAQTGTSPKIANIEPNPVYVGGSVTITGSNFKSGNEVYLKILSADSSGYNIVPNIRSNSKNGITFSIDQSIAPGNYEVYVENSNGVSPSAALIVVQPLTNPFPFIASSTPASGPAGTIITLTGGNFSEENDISYYTSDYTPYPITQEKNSENLVPQNSSGAIPGVKSFDGSTLQFQLPAETTPGIYTINLSNSKGYSDETYFTLIDPASQGVHFSGTNIKGPDGTVYFIDSSNTRSAYTSAGAFLSYKYNSWASVVAATAADMELPLTKYVPLGASQETTYFIPPRNGSLFKDRGIVYLISNGQRTAFTSAKVFLNAGYSFSNIQQGDTSFMVTLVPINSSDTAHADGTLINDAGTVFVMKNGYRVGFPSLASLNSWGYSAPEVVPANANDLKVQISGVASKRRPNELNI
jgi:hypothetical protein